MCHRNLLMPIPIISEATEEGADKSDEDHHEFVVDTTTGPEISGGPVQSIVSEPSHSVEDPSQVVPDSGTNVHPLEVDTEATTQPSEPQMESVIWIALLYLTLYSQVSQRWILK